MFSSKKRKNNILGRVGFFALLLCWIITPPQSAQAGDARFSVTPGNLTVTLGQTIRAQVVVGSGTGPINAADGTLVFPSNLLQATNISKNGVFGFWQTEPSVNNQNGSVRFAGGTNKPFAGTGAILTITFRTTGTGVANISVTNSTILAADGEGTNVQTGSTPAQWTIKPGTPQPPNAPTITSPTHPDQNTWYNQNQPEFAWDLPGDTVAVGFVLDQNPDTLVSGQQDPVQAFNQTSPLSDGTYYFHVHLKNTVGWSDTSHFTIHIDTAAPIIDNFDLPDTTETAQRHPYVSLIIHDTGSGIAAIVGQINGDVPFPLTNISNDKYELPLQTPGKKHLRIIATDKAGNQSVAEKDFEVTEVAPGEFIVQVVHTGYSKWLVIILGIIILLLLILLLILLFWRKRRDKKPPPPMAPPVDKRDNSDDPPMYEVTANE